ncbi:hypothetical protein ROHU_004126 [Labeo rohita]|uniref:Uncharacterized protein n=1 Tax=Labeo rohita TaxID=84645 RepID=A0A498NQ39_LABRO|nr:hypothetical protein ROHU_004126 [Labeo rohita]
MTEFTLTVDLQAHAAVVLCTKTYRTHKTKPRSTSHIEWECQAVGGVPPEDASSFIGDTKLTVTNRSPKAPSKSRRRSSATTISLTFSVLGAQVA